MNEEAVRARLAVVENQRRALVAYGWGATPALDAEIDALRSMLPATPAPSMLG